MFARLFILEIVPFEFKETEKKFTIESLCLFESFYAMFYLFPRHRRIVSPLHFLLMMNRYGGRNLWRLSNHITLFRLYDVSNFLLGPASLLQNKLQTGWLVYELQLSSLEPVVSRLKAKI